VPHGHWMGVGGFTIFAVDSILQMVFEWAGRFVPDEASVRSMTASRRCVP
jgi:hypothetical protein